MDMDKYWETVFAKVNSMSKQEVVDLLRKSGFNLSDISEIGCDDDDVKLQS